MTNTSPNGKPNTRIQFTTDGKGKEDFLEYSVNGQNIHEHIKDLEEAVEGAQELGHSRAVAKLEEFRHTS